MRSRTEVYLRNCASAGGSRDRSSRRKYSDTNRSSPLKLSTLAELPPPPASTAPRGTGRQASPPSARSARRPRSPRARLPRPPAAARPPARPAGGPPRRSRAPIPAPASGRAAVPAPPGSRPRSASRPERTGTAPRARPDRTDWRRRADRRARAPAGARVRPVRARHAGRASPRRIPRAGQRVEHLGRERLDPVNRGRDVAQEHHGVVVSPVERDPRERTRIGLGPLRKQGRLAVPGRRDHGRERRARRAEPCDHVRLRHGAGPGQRRGELDLREVERDLCDRHRRASCQTSESDVFMPIGMRRRRRRVRGPYSASQSDIGRSRSAPSSRARRNGR